MKKLISLILGFILLSLIVLAADRAPTPKPFELFFNYNGKPVVGLNVEFTVNDETIIKKTNSVGGVGIDIDLGYSDFKIGKSLTLFQWGSQILKVSCGFEVCNKEFMLGNINTPYKETYTLSEAPPEPEPECIVDSECSTGYECVNENCIYIDLEPEPIVEEKVTSNSDNTIASVESNFGDCIDVVITDTKLDKLFDGIIDFNTEDYDTHEEILVKTCSETSIDDVDYGLDVYVLIEEGEIEYRYVFDDLLPLNEIEDDEELEINFLGEDYEIISLSSSKMIIRHGEVFDYLEGCVEEESIDIDGLPLTIGTIGNDFVYVTYNGDSEQIYREDTGEVGGIQVYVDEAIPRKDKPNICKIRVAEDIEEIIEDGDEYNENWDYSIGEGYIGVRNSEEFKYLDEETKPLTLGDKITLPNDFAVIKFNEITSSETTDIRIKLRDGLFNVLGDRQDGQNDAFTYDNQDYDELYVSAEGISDKDKVFISNKVRIGESDVYLEKGSILIGDLTIGFDFIDILYKGISFALDDDNYLTHEGIIFKNPKNSVKDQSTFDISVPDEVPKLVITIGAESETIGVETEPEVCDPVGDTATSETPCEVCTGCIIQEPCEEVIEPTCPPVTNNLSAIIITGILTLAGGAAIFFKLFNNKMVTGVGYGVKFYRGRDGTLKITHKHPGTTGYHNSNTSHRNPEKHPRDMVDCSGHYQKNSKGEWEYIK